MKGINWKPESKIGCVVSARLDKETEEKIRKISEENNINLGTVARRIIEYYFEEVEKGK